MELGISHVNFQAFVHMREREKQKAFQCTCDLHVRFRIFELFFEIRW